ncbi:hypothetical protein ACFX5K_02215 [Rickettsiales bacterium LUAb2]
MFLRLFDAFKGLTRTNILFKSLHEDIKTQYSLIKLMLDDYLYAKNLKSNLNCRLETIKNYYKHMEYYHLEVFATNGIFLNNERLSDIYPHITVIETSSTSFEKLELRLDNTLCQANLIELDITKDPINFETKFNSISLQFVLDTLPGGINQIEQFLINLKNNLNPHVAVIFGTVVVGVGLEHKARALNYIKQQNKNKKWFNLDLKLDDLVTIFERHFETVSLRYEGSCLFFMLQPELQKLNLKPKLPKDHPLDIPFI